jgi:hypothetical protein
MSVGLTILLALAAWALGPLILRCAGGLLASCALMLWAIPMGTHTSTAALAFTAISGGVMWHTGTIWRARRDAARLTGNTAGVSTNADRRRHGSTAPPGERHA